ncbi:MAG: hypothetical protein WC460_02165 [Patescibacteria group bacterium]
MCNSIETKSNCSTILSPPRQLLDTPQIPKAYESILCIADQALFLFRHDNHDYILVKQ